MDFQCHLVLKAIILIHNFHTDYVGYSQIKLFSTENTSSPEICTDIIELHNIISIRVNTIVS
jgi:hypothetical protein